MPRYPTIARSGTLLVCLICLLPLSLPAQIYRDKNQPINARVNDLVRRMTLQEKIQQMVDDAPENTRLGIPVMRHGEVLHGVVATKDEMRAHGISDGGPTIFPQAIGLGATWDPALVEQVASAIAIEARSLGIQHAYGPVLDVQRDPRFGRTEETYGEDPYLVSKMGVAYVLGLQGQGKTRFDADHLIATGKHFAGYQESAGGLNGAYADISKRTFYETHLPPFAAAIREAGLGSIMPAHTDIDGVPAHMNTWLLGDMLRKTWGFQGFVVSDNIDVYRLFAMHHVAHNEAEAAYLALRAGVDMELDLSPGQKFATYQHHLAALVARGLVKQSEIDQSVKRILSSKFELGLFDAPLSPSPAKTLGSAEHRSLARRAAEEVITLLKNDGTLPLAPGKYKHIAIIGPHGSYVEYGGYTGEAHIPGVPLNDALTAQMPGTKIVAVRGANVTGTDTASFAQAIQTARSADLVIMAVGGSRETCGEGADRDDIDLPGVQQQLFDEISTLGKPIVTVLTNGRPLTIQRVVAQSNAVLEGWYLGSEAGTALAEALLGTINPGGKLTVTFPRTLGDLPAYYQKKPSFSGLGRGKYIDSSNSPLFPFGFGLSYTTFRLSNYRLAASHIPRNGETTLLVDVSNTGSRKGDEVVQMYVSEEVASIGTWNMLLKGFTRVTLQPGETKTVAFKVGFDQLAVWNASFQHVVEPGEFALHVGTSSAELHTLRLVVDGLPGPFPPASQIRTISDSDDAETGPAAKHGKTKQP